MARFIGVLGEDDSDAESLKILIQRLREQAGKPQVSIKTWGSDGCAHLLRKGAGQLKAWAIAGCDAAFVCFDADNDPAYPIDTRRQQLEQDVIEKSGVGFSCCPVIPVQELEAWWHADLGKLAEVFHWCRGLDPLPNPERINNPKEALRNHTRNPKTGKFHFHTPTHNPAMAKHVDLDEVAKRCPSFAAFVAAVNGLAI